jgi:hypothetical protein
VVLAACAPHEEATAPDGDAEVGDIGLPEGDVPSEPLDVETPLADGLADVPALDGAGEDGLGDLVELMDLSSDSDADGAALVDTSEPDDGVVTFDTDDATAAPMDVVTTNDGSVNDAASTNDAAGPVADVVEPPWTGTTCSAPPAAAPTIDPTCPDFPATGCTQTTRTPVVRWSFDPPNPRADSGSANRASSGSGAAAWAISDSAAIGGGYAFYRAPDLPGNASGSGTLFNSTAATIEVLLRFRHPVAWSGLPGHALGNRTDLLAFNSGATAPSLSYSRDGFNSMLPGGLVSFDFKGGGPASWAHLGDGTWHHVALVLETVASGVRARLFIDGENPEGFDTTVSGAFPTFNTVRGGFYQPRGVDVDELAIFASALPATHLAQRARESRGGTRPSDTDRCEPRVCSRATSGGAAPQELYERGFVEDRPYAPSRSPTRQYLDAPLPRWRRGHTLPRILSNWIHGPYSVAEDDPANWVRHGAAGSTLTSRAVDTLRAPEAAELVARWNYAASGLLTGDGTSYPEQNPYTQFLRALPAAVPVTIASGRADEGRFGTEIVDASGRELGLSPASPTGPFRDAGTSAAAGLRNLENTIGHRIDMIKYDWEGASGHVFQNVPDSVWANISGLTANVATRDFCSNRGLGWRACLAEGMTRLRIAFAEAHIATLQRGRPAIHFYDIGGNEHYQGDFAYTRTQNDPIPTTIDPRSDGASDAYRFSTNYIYPLNAYRWYYTVGAGRGLQWILDARAREIAAGSRWMMPYVAAGWSYDERRNMRPPQWLGLLKAVTAMGALTSIPAFFVIPCTWNTQCGWGVSNDAPCLADDTACRGATVPNPNRRAWQVLMPAYAQAPFSHAEDILRDPASVWLGDMHLSHPNVAAGGMRLGQRVVLAVATMPNGTDRFHYQQLSSPVSVAFDDDGRVDTPARVVRVDARVQGSVYLFDFATNPVSLIQLDAWHDWRHPDHWSSDFILDAEVADTRFGMAVRGEAPGAVRGDWTGLIGFAEVADANDARNFEAQLNTAPRLEFDVEPRNAGGGNYAIWARARLREGSTPGRVWVWAGDDVGSAVGLGCVGATEWQWVRLDCARRGPGTVSMVAGRMTTLKVAPSHAGVAIDRVVLTRTSDCIETSASCGCGP